MKALHLLFVLLFLSGCAATRSDDKAAAGSETMMIVYHPKPGKESELQATLSQAWEIYRTENMVFTKPHYIGRGTEDGNKETVVEVFTWIKAPEHPPDSVNAIWAREQSLCEARDGQRGIDAMEIVTGK